MYNGKQQQQQHTSLYPNEQIAFHSIYCINNIKYDDEPFPISHSIDFILRQSGLCASKACVLLNEVRYRRTLSLTLILPIIIRVIIINGNLNGIALYWLDRCVFRIYVCLFACLHPKPFCPPKYSNWMRACVLCVPRPIWMECLIDALDAHCTAV